MALRAFHLIGIKVGLEPIGLLRIEGPYKSCLFDVFLCFCFECFGILTEFEGP